MIGFRSFVRNASKLGQVDVRVKNFGVQPVVSWWTLAAAAGSPARQALFE
jgi:hypothetical protein